VTYLRFSRSDSNSRYSGDRSPAASYVHHSLVLGVDQLPKSADGSRASPKEEQDGDLEEGATSSSNIKRREARPPKHPQKRFKIRARWGTKA
jgi:hypothetical protein